MLKRTLPLPALLMLLSACQSDFQFNEGNLSADAIQVHAVSASHSRAAESYCNNNMPESFTMWAKTSHDAPEPDLIYFRDKTLVQNGADYIFEEGTPFWPKEGGLDFFAFRSDEESFNRDVHNPRFDHYTVKDEVAEQLDLIYAVKRNNLREDGPVLINFRHALSQIVFRAKVTNPSIEVTVHDVAIAGKLYNRGTFTFPTDTDTDTNWIDESHSDADDSNIYPDETGLGEWSDCSATTSFPGIYTAQTYDTPINVSSGVQVLTQSPSGHGKDEWAQVMALLPQKQEAWNPVDGGTPEGTYLKVNCTITNNTGEEGDAKVKVHEGYTYVPLAIDWKQGVRYVYTLNFGSDQATGIGDFYPIEVACTVDDFLPYEDPVDYNATVTVNFWTNDGETCFKTLDFVKDIDNGTLTLPTTAPRQLVGEVKEVIGWSTAPNRSEPEFRAGEQFTVDYSKDEINLYMNLGFSFTVNFYEWVEDPAAENGGRYVLSTLYAPQKLVSSNPTVTYTMPENPVNMMPEHKPATYGKTFRLPGWSDANVSLQYDDRVVAQIPTYTLECINFAGWAEDPDHLENGGNTSHTISSDNATLNLYASWKYFFGLGAQYHNWNGACYSRMLLHDYNTTVMIWKEAADSTVPFTDLNGAGFYNRLYQYPHFPNRGFDVLGYSYADYGLTTNHTEEDCDYVRGDDIEVPHGSGDCSKILNVVYGPAK